MSYSAIQMRAMETTPQCAHNTNPNRDFSSYDWHDGMVLMWRDILVQAVEREDARPATEAFDANVIFLLEIWSVDALEHQIGGDLQQHIPCILSTEILCYRRGGEHMRICRVPPCRQEPGCRNVGEILPTGRSRLLSNDLTTRYQSPSGENVERILRCHGHANHVCQELRASLRTYWLRDC